MKEFENAIEQHKAKIDKQVKDFIDKGLADGSITEDSFQSNDKGEKLFTLNDQDGKEIVYNYTLSRVHTYGGNKNN